MLEVFDVHHVGSSEGTIMIINGELISSVVNHAGKQQMRGASESYKNKIKIKSNGV